MSIQMMCRKLQLGEGAVTSLIPMEWGWMRLMRKSVLYLVEMDVGVAPADMGGLIKYRFRWDNPEPDVRNAVSTNLLGAPLRK